MARHIPLPPPRKLDSRRANTGFGKTPSPKRGEHGRDIAAKIETIVEAAKAGHISTGVDPTCVFKIVAGSRLSDADLRNRGLQPLGETPDWCYFALPSDRTGAEFLSAAREYSNEEASLTFFDTVLNLLPFDSDDRSGFGIADYLESQSQQPVVVDIHLWPADLTAQAAERLSEVRQVLAETDSNLGELGSDEQPAFLLVRARVDGPLLKQLLQLSPVFKVRIPPEPHVSPQQWTKPSDTVLTQPELVRKGVVGMIDDGVANGHVLLDGLVRNFSIPENHDWAQIANHGTMVAGLAAYGDLEDAISNGAPLPNPIRVIAVRTVEADASGKASYPSADPEHVILEKAIRLLHKEGAKVINISMSDAYAFSETHVDARTQLIDQLVRELDLVIVLPTGNVPTADLPDAPEIHSIHPSHLLTDRARAALPSIAANAISVGSVARSEQGAHADGDSPPTMRAVAGAGEVSPFSRTGPGVKPSSSVKPDFVHYGGNYVTEPNLSSRTLITTNPGSSVISLSKDGGFRAGCGTSYASPRVAHAAAIVRAEYPDATANLTRALLGVTATQPAPVAGQDAFDTLRTNGFGIPDGRRAIESVSNRVVMTFDGEMVTNTASIHPVPIPAEFATGKRDRSIAVALAFSPLTRRFRREYLAGTMKLDLYRAFDIEDLAILLKKQPEDDKKSLPADRRRIRSKLQPGTNALLGSTLQVCTWNPSAANSLSADDGDTYFLVVTHSSEPWADDQTDTTEKYALATQLTDRSEVSVNILQRLQDRVRQRS